MTPARKGLEPKKMGRPPAAPGQAKGARFELRCLPADLEAWRRAADAAGQSLAEWMAQACNERAGK